MKYTFLLISILLSPNLFSQKIEESKFDVKDSIQTFKTTTEAIGTRIVVESGDIKTLSGFVVYSRSLAKSNTTLSSKAIEPLVSLFFVPERITSINGGISGVKVKFTDGEVVEHKHEGSNKLVGTNQAAVIYFTVFTTDKLFTTPIKSIKVSVSSGDYEFEIDEKKKDIIKNSLQLIYEQTK
jgi:hypothetical protein